MAWETRGLNGGVYYYRKARRPDGTVASRYAGSGPLAVAASEIDGLVRDLRAWRRMAEGVVLGDVDRADGAVRAATAAVREALWAELEGRGLRYHRGEWRRPRREAGQAAGPAAGPERRAVGSNRRAR